MRSERLQGRCSPGPGGASREGRGARPCATSSKSLRTSASPQCIRHRRLCWRYNSNRGKDDGRSDWAWPCAEDPSQGQGQGPEAEAELEVEVLLEGQGRHQVHQRRQGQQEELEALEVEVLRHHVRRRRCSS